MTIYADTSFLIAIYSIEPNTTKAAAELSRVNSPVQISSLSELEVANALQLRVFRGHLKAEQARQGFGSFQADVDAGIFTVHAVPQDVYDLARRLSEKWSAVIGTRSLDIIHVACALLLGADTLFSFDEKQNQLARKEGLKIL